MSRHAFAIIIYFSFVLISEASFLVALGTKIMKWPKIFRYMWNVLYHNLSPKIFINLMQKKVLRTINHILVFHFAFEAQKKSVRYVETSSTLISTAVWQCVLIFSLPRSFSTKNAYFKNIVSLITLAKFWW